MVIKLGLSATAYKYYVARLTKTHQMYYKITLMGLDHKPIKDLTPRFVDGQITFDFGGENTQRVAEVMVLDHDRALGLESAGGSLSSTASKRMIRIHHVMYVPELNRWVACPMFTGPITGVEREGAFLSLVCSSKEYLMGDVWTGAYTIKKGTNRIGAAKKLLIDGGESKLRMPQGTVSKMPADRAVARTANRWKMAKSIVGSTARFLAYDSWGWAYARAWTATSPVYTFRSGTDQAVLSHPNVDYDFDNVINSVRVIGKKPKKGKTPTARADLPDYHPASSYALRRNGKRHWRGKEIQNSDLRSEKECKNYASAVLKDEAERTLDLTFDSAVIPFLEPGDPCSISTNTVSMWFRLRQATIPLQPGGAMSVGYHRDLKVVKPKRKKKKKRKKK